MSHRESNDPGRYALPEDSRLRLQQLHGHIALLCRLARPHAWGGTPEGAPEIRMDELAACLSLWAEQAGRVLDDLARRPNVARAATTGDGDGAAAVPGSGAAGDGQHVATSFATGERRGDAATAEAAHAGGAPFVFGVTLDQVDALARRVQTIAAHGDVVASAQEADLADATLPVLGQAIVEAAEAVRAILDAVERNRIGGGDRPRGGVREDRSAYGAVLPSAAMRKRRRTRARRRPAMRRHAFRFGSVS
ncbi:XAC0095 family protein [Luteimonas huabeiensis]|uniref:XAC0095 family protein n=1 Tax=Luteimonas huabeiensis TaxID=1244513 RepID=UPI0004B6D2AB|nr:hypothetical protein [Luteimonas huabeiensis]